MGCCEGYESFLVQRPYIIVSMIAIMVLECTRVLRMVIGLAKRGSRFG